MKIIEAYQVPKGNISPDIFSLPCVLWAAKDVDGSIGYKLSGFEVVKFTPPIAKAGDWICKDKHEYGKWRVLTDEEYQRTKIELKSN